MSKFNPEKVFEFTKSIAFPRLVGTAGEREAALKITQAFKDLGLEVIEERFEIPILPWTIFRISLILILFFLITARFIGERFPLIAIIILFAVVVGTWLAGKLWQSIIKSKVRLKQKDVLKSTNIIAHFPDSDYNKKGVTLYLSSHYDTKSQSISLPVRIILVFLLYLSLSFLILILLFTAFGPGVPGQGEFDFKAILDIPVLIATLSVILLLFVKTHNKSPGALDNAAAVGLLLGIAEVVREKRPKNLKLGFIIFAAEELGLIGSNNFVVRHRNEFDKNNFHLLNFDGVGVAQRLRVCHGARFSLAFPKDRLADAVKKAADQTKTRLGILPLFPGLLMDHVPFAAEGFETLSLASLASESSKIHTKKDTIDLVEIKGLEEVGNLTLKVIEILDESYQFKTNINV